MLRFRVNCEGSGGPSGPNPCSGWPATAGTVPVGVDQLVKPRIDSVNALALRKRRSRLRIAPNFGNSLKAMPDSNASVDTVSCSKPSMANERSPSVRVEPLVGVES